jgi:hypothetical protein
MELFNGLYVFIRGGKVHQYDILRISVRLLFSKASEK